MKVMSELEDSQQLVAAPAGYLVECYPKAEAGKRAAVGCFLS